MKINLLDDKAILPQYAHHDDSGCDLFSIDSLTIEVGERVLVRTGINIELEPNTEAQIRPKSGLALEHGVTVLNTPGTVDEGYKGEIKVILINLGGKPFRVNYGMKIAQVVIAPVIRPSELKVKLRGDKGFGSTGV